MILTSASPFVAGLSIGVSAAYAASAAGGKLSDKTLSRVTVWLAWIFHAILLALGLLGSAPRFGFAPALSVTAWLVGLVYAIESNVYPQMRTPWLLSGAGAAAVLLALLFPGNPLNETASAWLPLHWALGIASYGLFAVAVVHAWLMKRAEARMRTAVPGEHDLPLLTMERLTFHFVSLGFALLSATLVAGFFFGTQLYGPSHAIKWDHKTIFSLLSWVTFAVLMVGRLRFGWRGKKAIRVLYFGAGLLLLAYVGSRFVMEVILERAV
jgi:ABC-type uncharacterized transport system permease subunit